MERFDYTMLGKLIIEQLGFEDENADLTSKWMANYIAQKMKEAEAATGKKKKETEEDCFKAILELWKRREDWLGNGNPYKNLIPIMDTINKLNPENQTYFYWCNNNEPDVVEPEVQQILDIIKSVDETARVCLEYLFKQVLETTIDETMKKWIKAAAEFTDVESTDIFLIRRFAEHIDSDKEYSIEKEKLKKRICILKEFQEKSEELLKLYERELIKEDT